MTRTRFAPSPTGLLHLGHAHAARVAVQRARREAGECLLRFEDIDHTRCRGEFFAAIEEDLRWLGIGWDGEPLRQSGRAREHQSALERLRGLGVLYPCFCTRREINDEVARMARAPHGPEGPLYPGICRRLEPAERDRRIRGGAEPAWRLDAGEAAARCGALGFRDEIHGSFEVDPGLLGDVVLARKDIGTSYHLAVVVDDADQGITHVTRGEDLLHSTHVHRLLQSLLGYPEPVYLHHGLVTGSDGQRLAKRDESLAIRHLREAGRTPAEVLAMLPSLPW